MINKYLVNSDKLDCLILDYAEFIFKIAQVKYTLQLSRQEIVAFGLL